MTARKKAWKAYFKAYDALYPKTIEDILWIMAKAGHTQLVAPLMNLSKVTRSCNTSTTNNDECQEWEGKNTASLLCREWSHN